MEQKQRTNLTLQKAKGFRGTVLVASLMGCMSTEEAGGRVNHPGATVMVTALECNAACMGNRTDDSKRTELSKAPECNVPSAPRPGDVIPECARRTDYFGIPEAEFDGAARARLEEVRRRYGYMKIEPNVAEGRIRGVFVTTSLYGSGDTAMWGWFEYISSGVKP